MKDNGLLSGVIGAIAVNAITVENGWALYAAPQWH